jgi:hypothetical protein
MDVRMAGEGGADLLRGSYQELGGTGKPLRVAIGQRRMNIGVSDRCRVFIKYVDAEPAPM